MASPLRSGSAPRCLACIRRYAFNGIDDALAPKTSLRQQVRGKRKMVNNSGTVTVRLLKDMEGYGQRGSLLPLPRGQMRNEWFPRGIADYVVPREEKKLRLSNTPIQRDHSFTRAEKVNKVPLTCPEEGMSKDEITSASKFAKKVDVAKLAPHRMVALLEAFVGPRLDFYRQPIIEEKVEEVVVEEAPEPLQKRREDFGSGAGADLLAARMGQPTTTAKREEGGKAQAIYGSVSPLDVVQALRAALAVDEDAKRVVLSEQDVQFVDLPESEGETAKVVKHVGDFEVDITVRGFDTPVRRTVRIIPQEA